jgi:hypothetical protein
VHHRKPGVHERALLVTVCDAGKAEVRDAWARFIDPAVVVGIQVNCSGAPRIMSTPEVGAEIVRNLVAAGVKPARIWIYSPINPWNWLCWPRKAGPGLMGRQAKPAWLTGKAPISCRRCPRGRIRGVVP